MNQLYFIQHEFPKLVATLNADTKGNWGVLNAQQMVEHMSESVKMATGKDNQRLVSPADKVDAFKSFAMSDREFKPNTKNVLMPEIPVPVSKTSMQEAIAEYKETVEDFISYFENNAGAKLTNPFFGDLNYLEWLHLLHKHATHHCKQFGLIA